MSATEWGESFCMGKEAGLFSKLFCWECRNRYYSDMYRWFFLMPSNMQYLLNMVASICFGWFDMILRLGVSTPEDHGRFSKKNIHV